MNRILLRILIIPGIFFLFTMLQLPVFSQHHYIIEHYSNENGLPANGINGIELDKKNGYLWVGTQGGLVRFDGKHFTSFATNRDARINSRVALITRNREGAIFVGDDNFSVNRIDKDQLVFMLMDTFFIPHFRPLDGEFKTWSPQKVAEKVCSLKVSSFFPPWVIFRDVPEDSSSFSFLVLDKGYHYQSSRNRLLQFPEFDRVLKFNRQTYFYHSAKLELYLYSDSLGNLLPARIQGWPSCKSEGKEKPSLIWKPGMEAPLFICGRDLWKLTGSNDSLQLQPVCLECCPENGNINSAQIWEEQGLLFLGSVSNGLYVVKTPFIRSVRLKPTIEAGNAEYGQVEIFPGLITTATGLTFSSQGKLIDGKPSIRFPYSNIYQDKQGDCWFSSGDTIVHYYRKEGRLKKILSSDRAIKMVFAEMNDRMYVISDLSIVDITGDQYRPVLRLNSNNYHPKGFLTPDEAFEWKPGTLAIAGGKLLLFRPDKPDALDTLHIPGLTTKVRSLMKYGDYLFIGTYGQGFYIFKDGVLKKMPTDKNKYLSYTHCFIQDDNGFIWISTNHGLFKASLSTLLTAFEQDLDEIFYQYFGKDDGIFSTEFNGGCQPCALRMSSGLFSFPTMNGMAVFDPLQQHAPVPKGEITIDEVWVNDKLYQTNDHYLQAIPYHSGDLRFRIAMPQFGNSENIYFSYKLDPYNDDWESQDLLQHNSILFRKLKPGTYTLLLRVRNGFGPNQFGTTQISFRILQPWYQTWWFMLLCMLGFVTLIWALIKWRTARIAKRKEELQELVKIQTQNIESQSRQLQTQLKQLQSQQLRLEEDNNVKARLIGIISHDMISPLKFMAYMSNRLKDGFSESDPSYHTAGFIANVAQELESLSENILNWIKFHHQSVQMKPERFNLQELIAESVEIPSTLAREKGLSFKIESNEQAEILQYRQAIGVIIYNLAMNATKYTQQGSIQITSKHSTEEVILTVADTGPGMPPGLVRKLNSPESFVAGYSIGETSKYQFGYVIIKDLLRLVDGTMTVESIEQKGTKAKLRFRKVMD